MITIESWKLVVETGVQFGSIVNQMILIGMADIQKEYMGKPTIATKFGSVGAIPFDDNTFNIVASNHHGTLGRK